METGHSTGMHDLFVGLGAWSSGVLDPLIGDGELPNLRRLVDERMDGRSLPIVEPAGARLRNLGNLGRP